ncbi:MAG: hypothetical protein NVS3B20_25090 [Polyangiales bacterium]
MQLITRHYVDATMHRGAYFGTVGVEVERSMGACALSATAQLGWANRRFNSAYFGEETAALNLLEARVLSRCALTPSLYVALHGEVSTILASRLRQSVEEPALMVGGMAIGMDF